MNAALEPAVLARRASVTRNTVETQIAVSVDLDGTGRAKLATGVAFLDHMLDQIARQARVPRERQAKGARHTGDRNTIADTGATPGRAGRARWKGGRGGRSGRSVGWLVCPAGAWKRSVTVSNSGGPALPNDVATDAGFG